MKENKTRNLLSTDTKKSLPLYSISIAAELLSATDQTLRLYEKHGLIKPSKRNRNRYYSENDIQWIRCLRDLIHNKKISIEAIKKLLKYAPCWEIMDCSEEIRNSCSAYKNSIKQCWELNKIRCKKEENKSICEECNVYNSSKVTTN